MISVTNVEGIGSRDTSNIQVRVFMPGSDLSSSEGEIWDNWESDRSVEEGVTDSGWGRRA